MSRRRERRRQEDRTADRIAMALEMIRCSDERWHGLAVPQRHGPRYRAARPAGGQSDAEAIPGRGDGKPAAGVLTPKRSSRTPSPLARV
jgi:hypothetical protein